ncbi:MAG: anhydro-N-acetylmuramic acid kinase [Mariprofundaceae bacterium]|nr:anhydro-N-acetylmuramic acid kinase [Mariprofundaceae bacterium]
MTPGVGAPPLFIGIMSGTSCDGIDVAIVRMDEKPQLVDFCEHSMPEKLREPILRLSEPGIDEIDAMGELGCALGSAFANTALRTIEHAGLNVQDIATIGCHGQTIRHQPHAKHPFTLQIGSAAVIAEKTGITTVSDFRSRDLAADGEGAPLVPFAHRLLFASDTENIAVLNIGGIANITWLGSDGKTVGFDTGPGNMVMDELMLALTGGRCAYDTDGELAARGSLCRGLLDQLMQHPFLKRQPPKSTGREDFGHKIADQILAWPDLNDADRVATACAFTIHGIASAIRFLPDVPDAWLVCGGGARNPYLMRKLSEHLAPASVSTTETAGIPPQAVEAVSFAILAHRTILGQNNILSAVTGARRDVCGGTITPGNNWPELLQRLSTWTR